MCTTTDKQRHAYTRSVSHIKRLYGCIVHFFTSFLFSHQQVHIAFAKGKYIASLRYIALRSNISRILQATDYISLAARHSFSYRENPSVFCFAKSSFHSMNWHPFVCFADISPNRGIPFQGRQDESKTRCYYKCNTLALISLVLPTFQKFSPKYPQVLLVTFILR